MSIFGLFCRPPPGLRWEWSVAWKLVDRAKRVHHALIASLIGRRLASNVPTNEWSERVSHGGSAPSAVGSASDSYHKGLGFDSRNREKAGTTETRIFHVLTFTAVSVVRNPLETVGPVVEAVASSNYI